jgi:PTH1 family peptidyl-tRNA hydrolase
LARVNRAEGPVWLLQPQTFMNLSGQSVAPLARFFKIAPSEILVVHDELDLAPGQMKLKQGGGAAGHNGLKDILAQLGSPDFWRLRIGIGHPGARHEVANWVLRKPPQDERIAIEKCVDDSLAALPQLLAGDFQAATSKVHAGPQRTKPPRREPAPGPSGATGAPVATAIAAAARSVAAGSSGKAASSGDTTAGTTAVDTTHRETPP